MCLSILLGSSTSSILGDSMLVIVALMKSIVCGNLSYVCEGVCEVGHFSMGIRVYLRCCVRTSVMFNSIFTSSFAFWRVSITSFSFCLFTWVAYCVTFRREMTCTTVPCCFVCSCISCFICCLISHESFIVAVPVNHCSAS